MIIQGERPECRSKPGPSQEKPKGPLGTAFYSQRSQRFMFWCHLQMRANRVTELPWQNWKQMFSAWSIKCVAHHQTQSSVWFNSSEQICYRTFLFWNCSFIKHKLQNMIVCNPIAAFLHFYKQKYWPSDNENSPGILGCEKLSHTRTYAINHPSPWVHSSSVLALEPAKT